MLCSLPPGAAPDIPGRPWIARSPMPAPRPRTTDIVYPWCPTAFDELRYAVRSAAMHFANLRRCWVYGLSDPGIDLEYVTWRKSPNRGRHADEIMLRAMLAAANDPAVSDPFVLSCDDYYWLRDTEVADLEPPMALEKLDLGNAYYGPHPWRRRLWSTLLRLHDQGYTTYNYCTHAPVLIHKARLRQAIEVLGTDVQVETAYFNITWNTEPAAYLTKSNWRAGFYEHTRPSEMMAQLAGKRFMSHNDDGLDHHLKDAIRSMFPVDVDLPAIPVAPMVRPALILPSRRSAQRHSAAS